MNAAFSLFAASVCCACATANIQTPEQTKNQIERAESFDASSIELGDKLLAAYKNGNVKAFLSLLPDDVTKTFGEKEFKGSKKAIADTMGEIQSYQFLTKLNAPVFKSYLWKVNFRRTNRDGEVFNQETVFRVITGELDGKPYAVSFGFL